MKSKMFLHQTAVILTIMLIFLGCEKRFEKDDLHILILGKWDVISHERIVYENNEKTDSILYSRVMYEEVLEFLDDSTGNVYYGGIQDYSFTWSISCSIYGPKNFLCKMEFIEEDGDLFIYQVSIEDDTLTYSGTDNYTDGGITYRIENTYIANRKKN